MVSTSGAQLLPEAATKTLIHELLPVAYLVTPNIPEANLILREAGKPAVDIEGLDGLKKLAASVLELGPKYVLIKGGHLPLTKNGKVAREESEKEIVTNVLVGSDGEVEVVKLPFQRSKNTHGTGCSLACELCPDVGRGLILTWPQLRSRATSQRTTMSNGQYDLLAVMSRRVS